MRSHAICTRNSAARSTEHGSSALSPAAVALSVHSAAVPPPSSVERGVRRRLGPSVVAAQSEHRARTACGRGAVIHPPDARAQAESGRTRMRRKR